MELDKITQAQFNKIYAEHQEWLSSAGEQKSTCANLINTDLRYIKFPKKANLSGANLFGSDLSGANLSGANLSGANLFVANLTEANLSGAGLRGANLVGAKLIRADLGGADLQGVNLTGVNLFGVNLSGANLIGSNITATQLKSALSYAGAKGAEHLLIDKDAEQEQIKRLKNLEAELASEKQLRATETEQSEEEINKRDTRINDLEKAIDVEKEDRTERLETSLKTAFDGLKNIDADIKPEIERLENLYFLFKKVAAAFTVILIILWVIAFCNLINVQDFKFIRLWLYGAPSIILVGFIWGCIVQINSAQEQLIALQKYSRKYTVIRYALTGYYDITHKDERTAEKAQETFSTIIERELHKEEFNVDKALSDIKENRGTKIPVNQVIEILIKALNK